MLKVTLPTPTVLIAKGVSDKAIVLRADKNWITWVVKRSNADSYDVYTCETKVFECQNNTELCQLTKPEIRKLAEAVGYKVK